MLKTLTRTLTDGCSGARHGEIGSRWRWSHRARGSSRLGMCATTTRSASGHREVRYISTSACSTSRTRRRRGDVMDFRDLVYVVALVVATVTVIVGYGLFFYGVL